MEVNVALVYLKIDVTNTGKIKFGINNISCFVFRGFGLDFISSSDNSEVFRVAIILHREKRAVVRHFLVRGKGNW